jgi:hypothetical protein
LREKPALAPKPVNTLKRHPAFKNKPKKGKSKSKSISILIPKENLIKKKEKKNVGGIAIEVTSTKSVKKLSPTLFQF